MNVLRYIITRSLPKTGQSIIYTAGDDGHYQKGWWKNRVLANNKVRFIDNGNDTITDRATGLMWEKVPSLTLRTLTGWIVYANALTLGGYSNWRVPNINELLSIVDYSVYDTATYFPFFNNISIDSYYTSTRIASNPNYLLAVDFYNGFTIYMLQNNSNPAICVRTI